MKGLKLKKLLAILIVALMLFSVFASFSNRVEAMPALEHFKKEKYKFNASDVLLYAARVGLNDDAKAENFPAIPTKVTDADLSSKKIVRIVEGTSTEASVNDLHGDGYDLRADDASHILIASYITAADPFILLRTMTTSLGVSNEDVVATYTIDMPAVGGVKARSSFSYDVKYVDGKAKVQLTDEQIKKYQQTVTEYDAMVNARQRLIEENTDMTVEQIDEMISNAEEEFTRLVEEEKQAIIGYLEANNLIQIKDFTIMSAKVKVGGKSEYAGSVYQLGLAYDELWYLVRTTDPTPAKFKTTLEYTSTPEGKMNDAKDTYLPPYYENEDKDAKKDVDATAIIKSTTKEEIVATNGVELTDKNVKGNPNSEGWYYPDLNDKTVIAKVYPFDKYNNPTDNGAVKEDVRLTGKDGGKDVQTPSVAWTLRRINYEEKTNDDKSVTVTITYNLPIDEKSIPEGWKAIKDSDGGIRKITRTFKPGEDYDKDVTVEQNGPSKATVTTPVKVRWNIATKIIPQTGESWTIVIAGAAALLGIAVISYRKFRK